MANEPRNLYQLDDYFKLYIGGVWHYIDEPIGWDKTSIALNRDKVYFGANYEFADEKSSLTFLERDGGSLLREVYRAEGSDGVVIFEYGYKQSSTEKPQFKGNINFNDYNVTDDGIEVTIQKVYFQSLLRTRWETKVSLSDVKTLDGADIVPLDPITINLHSKIIKKTGLAIQLGDSTEMISPTPVPNVTVYIQPDTQQIKKDELQQLEAMPVGVTSDTAPSDQRFQFKANESGLIRIKWECAYRLIITRYNFSTPIGNWNLVPIIQIYRAGVFVEQIAPAAARLNGYTGNDYLDISHSFSINTWANILAGDEVYFNINLTKTSGISSKYFISNHTNSIEITQDTFAPASTCKGYRIFDVFNYVVEAITGSKDAVLSAFFNSCGRNYLITSGFQIRGFDITEKPIKISLKDLMEGSNPIWAVGMQYSIAAGQDVIRIERVPTFFGSKKIFDLNSKKIDRESFSEAHLKEACYNEVEIGYQKFGENESNTLDDFCSYAEILAPLKTYKQKYIQRSVFITSGFLIESIRREQFKENPSTSVTNDDLIFLISFIEERKHHDVSFIFTSVPGTISLSKAVNMKAGDTFSMIKAGGGVNDATVFTVVSKDISAQEKYVITPAPVGDNGVGLIEIFITTPEAEKNEPFSNIEGLMSPETAYNLRLSVKRMLYNHSEILNGCLEKKGDAEQLKVQFYKNNGNLITKFYDQEECKMIDQNIDIKESESIDLVNYNSRRELFKPQVFKFKIKMNYNDLIHIKERVTGQTGTDEDYGFVTHEDLDGRLYESYVWEWEYEPYSEICSITLRKKREII